jgi:hypothetical protein
MFFGAYFEKEPKALEEAENMFMSIAHFKYMM